MIGTQTITVVRAGAAAVDAHGNAEPDWDNPTRTDISGCAIAPGAVDSNTADGRHGGSDVITIYVPGSDADIAVGDRIEHDGATFEVEERAATWPSGTVSGVTSGTVIEARRYEG